MANMPSLADIHASLTSSQTSQAAGITDSLSPVIQALPTDPSTLITSTLTTSTTQTSSSFNWSTVPAVLTFGSGPPLAVTAPSTSNSLHNGVSASGTGALSASTIPWDPTTETGITWAISLWTTMTTSTTDFTFSSASSSAMFSFPISEAPSAVVTVVGGGTSSTETAAAPSGTATASTGRVGGGHVPVGVVAGSVVGGVAAGALAMAALVVWCIRRSRRRRGERLAGNKEAWRALAEKALQERGRARLGREGGGETAA